MNANEKSLDSYRSFLLLSEIVGEEPISQREISRRLGIAVGLVNSYLKNLVSKGYVRVKNFPRNRYAYLLTPQGLVEKSRLACQHLHYFTNLYTVARQEYRSLFNGLASRDVRQVVFCGIDEVAEIAWLSMQEAGLELVGIFDDQNEGEDFMGQRVENLLKAQVSLTQPMIITSLKRTEQINVQLLELGFHSSSIFAIGRDAA